ncbi:MAG: site-2 protease family protein [Bacteroidetes bacterium]|nr:site-2 protease family protein [Bacteroidota bacterium]
MKWSLYLGKYSGTKLFVHWTFLILLGWIFVMHYQMGHGWKDGLAGVGFILAVFCCVVLHEFGHALTAKRFAIQTRNITLLPIGGIASMERLPEKPGQELQVAIMGPVVNVVIAVGLYVFLSVTNLLPTSEDIQSMQQNTHSMMGGENFLFNLMAVNVVLVLFNLIPAFPMDGGRVLRALLSYKFERGRATRIAAGIGQFLAMLFVFAGFFGNFWLVFIGIFIYLGASAEAQYETARSALTGYKVKDVFMRKFTLLSPTDTLDAATELLLGGQEKEFLVGEGDHVEGILTRKDIIKGLKETGGKTPVANVMRKVYLALKPEMPLKDIFQKMTADGDTFSPVFDDGILVGALDTENINEFLMIRSVHQNPEEEF